MAFRTSPVPAQAYQRAKDVAAQVRLRAQSLRIAALASTATSSQILGFAEYANTQRSTFLSLQAVDGIGAYAQEQEDDSAYDVGAEFTAMLSALTNARDWIVANFPKQGEFLLAQTINASGVRSDRVFLATQTAGLVTILDTLIGAIAAP